MAIQNLLEKELLSIIIKKTLQVYNLRPNKNQGKILNLCS